MPYVNIKITNEGATSRQKAETNPRRITLIIAGRADSSGQRECTDTHQAHSNPRLDVALPLDLEVLGRGQEIGLRRGHGRH